MPDTAPASPQSWHDRAEYLLEQALDEVQRNLDAIPTVAAALAALRIEAGELPASEMEDYPFPGDEAGICSCPPDLLERGGFRSSCPVHGQGSL